MRNDVDAKLGEVTGADEAEPREDAAAQEGAEREVESAAEDPEFSPLQDVALRDAVREVQRFGALRRRIPSSPRFRTWHCAMRSARCSASAR